MSDMSTLTVFSKTSSNHNTHIGRLFLLSDSTCREAGVSLFGIRHQNVVVSHLTKVPATHFYPKQ